jgi:type II secretory pathway component PulC
MILAFLQANLSRIIIGALIAALFGGYTTFVYQAGKNSVRVERLEETVKKVEDVNEIRNNVRRLPDGAAVVELRKDWSR